jgi:hypothetical protein
VNDELQNGTVRELRKELLPSSWIKVGAHWESEVESMLSVPSSAKTVEAGTRASRASADARLSFRRRIDHSYTLVFELLPSRDCGV